MFRNLVIRKKLTCTVVMENVSLVGILIIFCLIDCSGQAPPNQSGSDLVKLLDTLFSMSEQSTPASESNSLSPVIHNTTKDLAEVEELAGEVFNMSSNLNKTDAIVVSTFQNTIPII